MKTSYSLLELHQWIRRVFLLNFDEEVWVRAELSQVSIRNGHLYGEFVDQKEDGGTLMARAPCFLWSSQLKALAHHYGDALYDVLQAGIQLQTKCKINFDEKFGYSLQIQDIDLEYTFGNLYLQRQKTLQRLEQDLLLDLNNELALPHIIRRIAVISSRKAAGWSDFWNHLKDNTLGLPFEVDLYHVSVQGNKVTEEITNVFELIEERSAASLGYDCIVVLRGGGSKIDLAAFDSFEIAQAIALCSTPVISAIGHQTDTSVCDIVAHTSLKTPTAAAQFCVDRNKEVLTYMSELASSIEYEVTQHFALSKRRLDDLRMKLSLRAPNMIHTMKQHLDQYSANFRKDTVHKISTLRIKLQYMQTSMVAYDPKRTLDRGYAIVKQEGKWKKRKSEYRENQDAALLFSDGEIKIESTKSSN